jgi:starch synthase (maltosyl-transferring)
MIAPTRPAEAPPRIVIEGPQPTVDGGRWPAKRVVGDLVEVSADIFRDGHEKLRAVVRTLPPGETEWGEAEMHAVDAHHAGVRWQGEIVVDRMGRWEIDIVAWTDVWATWRDELARKVTAGQHDLGGELSEGGVLLAAAAERAATPGDKALIEYALRLVQDPDVPEAAKTDAALGLELAAAVERSAPRHGATSLETPFAIEVDRVRARFSAWYELFPRSFGGLNAVEAQVPRIADLGFDVLYLLPIHPIGRKNRKGPNNTLVAGPDDPGSPYAIGAAEGGHDAIHPELGTLEDLRSLTATAAAHGMDTALDLALNASADHPWLTEHPEWFQQRPDGTLKYAENPPKRYQDIYNFNWDTPAWRELWDAWLHVILHWVDAGVKVYRVDNPHTKPFPFWEWIIREVHKVDRDVIFLAEAFTRRAVMRELAKLGFTQSYTYFTWKNAHWELSEYLTELTTSGEEEYFRPNFFPNTPDILHEYLQHGGPPAFAARFVLAATLSPSYGIYSGFENFENVAVRPGSEEYLNSEKYEIHQRRLDGPLLPFIKRVNAVRHENPALQRLDNLTLLPTTNEALFAYAKQHGDNQLLIVVNLDPHHPQEGTVDIPADIGLPMAFRAQDLIVDEHFDWHVGHNFVRLAPPFRQSHILRVQPL